MITTEDRGLGPHMDDGALVRYLDGEASGGERARLEAHLATCDACARRLGVLRHRSEAWSAVLHESDPEPPTLSPPAAVHRAGPTPARRTWWGRWARAAVLAALLVGGLASVESVRAWVGRQWAVLAGHFTESQETVSTEDAVVGATVTFSPSSPVLTVTFDEAQPGAALLLRVATGEQASARVLGGDAALTVLASALRIHNSATDTADYHVAVPASLETVTVRIAGRVAASISVADIPPDGRTVALDPAPLP